MIHNLLDVYEAIASSKAPLETLIALGRDYTEHVPRLVSSAAADGQSAGFLGRMLSYADKTVQCSAERVVYKQAALSGFKEDLSGLLKKYLGKPRDYDVQDLRGVFEKWFFDDSLRFKLSERTNHFPLGDGEAQYFITRCEDDETLIDPYGTQRPWDVNFDTWTCHGATRNYVCKQYIETLLRLRDEQDLGGVVILDKYAGPEGVEKLRDGFAGKLSKHGIPTEEFSQRTKRIRPIGGVELPPMGSSLCLVFDVMRSGRGVSDAMKRIEHMPFAWKVWGSVVLLDYSPRSMQRSLRHVTPLVKDRRFAANAIDKVNWRRISGHSYPLGRMDELPDSLESKTAERRFSPILQLLKRQVGDVMWWEEHYQSIKKSGGKRWLGVADQQVYEAATKKKLLKIEEEQAVPFSVVTSVR